GKVAVNADAPARGDGGEVRFEDVTRDNRQARGFFRQTLQTRYEPWVEFNGIDRSAGGEQMLSHFAVPSADFYPAAIAGQPGGRRGVGRNADGARDLFAPIGVCKKMLAEALTGHRCNSVAGAGKARPMVCGQRS